MRSPIRASILPDFHYAKCQKNVRFIAALGILSDIRPTPRELNEYRALDSGQRRTMTRVGPPPHAARRTNRRFPLAERMPLEARLSPQVSSTGWQQPEDRSLCS